MRMNKDDFHRLAQAAEVVFLNTSVFLAYVYGSHIRGHPRPDSDLDVGYYVHAGTGAEALSLLEEMRMVDRLSRILNVEVDLRNLGSAPLELRGRVLERGCRIYCSDPVARVTLERDLLGMYHDYKTEFEMFHARRLRAVAAFQG